APRVGWPPVRQGETVVKFGPVIPKLIATWPAPTFGIPIGIRNGLIRSGPRVALIEIRSTGGATAPRPAPREPAGPPAPPPPQARRQPRLVHRLAGGDQPELDVAVRPPHLFLVEDA